MSQTPVTIKIDSDVKKQAQEVAQALGLSLSTIVENKLREVVRERRVVFEEYPVPNARTAETLKQIEADVKAGRNLSGPFATPAALKEHLSKLGHAD